MMSGTNKPHTKRIIIKNREERTMTMMIALKHTENNDEPHAQRLTMYTDKLIGRILQQPFGVFQALFAADA